MPRVARPFAAAVSTAARMAYTSAGRSASVNMSVAASPLWSAGLGQGVSAWAARKMSASSAGNNADMRSSSARGITSGRSHRAL